MNGTSSLSPLLLERDLKHHQVPRHHRVREYPPCLLEQREVVFLVSWADVDEHELANVRLPSHLRRLARCRMGALRGFVGEFVGERAVVDQHIGSPGKLDDVFTRPCVPCVGDFPSGAGRAYHLLWFHRAPIRQLDGLSCLETRKVGTSFHPKGSRFFGVKPPRALILNQCIGKGWHRVADIRGQDSVALAAEFRPRLQLAHLDIEGESVVGDLKVGFKSLALSRRTVDLERSRAVHQGQRLDEPSQAKEVVAVQVGYEDGVKLHGAEAGEGHLPLGTFGNVEQQELTVALQSYRWKPALDGRDAATCTEEDEFRRYPKY